LINFLKCDIIGAYVKPYLVLNQVSLKPKVQKEVKYMKYELMYILVNTLSDEEKDGMIEKVNALITKNGGVVESVDKIGSKKLAYEINKKHDGYYVLVNFSAESSVPATVTNTLRITENVLRYIVVAK
jgi:small subunit ribosomal protein S6